MSMLQHNTYREREDRVDGDGLFPPSDVEDVDAVTVSDRLAVNTRGN